MSSMNHFQASQFSKFSERRQKIDAQYMENAADIITEQRSQIDHRKSLAWDSAFFTSPGVLEPDELFQTLNFRASKPLEQEKTSNICQDNSRRSLAWDNEFFTSAGVLDPEELSLVNKGYKKGSGGRHLVPNNSSEEKIWRSAESSSAKMGDNSFFLESLEIDLFEDLKASFDNSSKTSDAANPSSRKGRDLKNSNAASRVKMKSMSASKRQNLKTNGSERTARLASLPPRAQNIARGGNSNPITSLKSPKVLGQVNSPSSCLSKPASSCTRRTRKENNATKAVLGQQMNVADKPCNAESCGVMPNFTSSSRSPSSDPHTPTNPTTAISPLNFGLSGSHSPLSNLAGNKFDLPNSGHLLSSLKSFNISPASSSMSISSSESLASISQISDKKSTEILDNTPCKETSSETNLHNECHSRHEQQDTRFQNQHVNKKAKGSSYVLKNGSRNIKPSGLRMPSPKLGFFDAENSIATTPNGELKFNLGAHTNSKTGRVTGCNKGSANRTILGKLQPKETGNTKTKEAIRSSNPATLKEDKGSQRFMANRNGMQKNIGHHHTLKAKNRKDDITACSRKVLHILDDDDNESLCCFHNKVDGLTKQMEAIDLTQDL